jgi:hypothetical protein
MYEREESRMFDDANWIEVRMLVPTHLSRSSRRPDDEPLCHSIDSSPKHSPEARPSISPRMMSTMCYVV